MRFLFLVLVLSSAAFAEGEPLPGTQPSRVSLTGDQRIDLRVIDNQIQLLEFQKVAVAGPVFLTAFGGAAVLAGAGMVLALGGSLAFFLIGLPLIGVGLVLASIGVVWLLINQGINRRLEKAIQALHDQRPSLARAPTTQVPAMVTLVTF